METCRPRTGGKIVTNRRKQRLCGTPYDRPPPLAERPSLLNGVIIPSARALASGAGKIISSVFFESESSSSEEEDFDLEDDVNNVNEDEIPYAGVNTSHERTETKRLIEQLIKQESYSREQCDRLIRLLNARVMDWSTEAGEKDLHAGSVEKAVDHEVVHTYNEAILAAKSWFQEKKIGCSPVTELAHGTFNYTVLEHLESGGGSPVDAARSYTKNRPVRGSPTENIELRTPLTTSMKFFKEGTLASVGHHPMSSLKKRSSFAYGSSNIQEELHRVCSEATEDILHAPHITYDLSCVAPSREKCLEADKLLFATVEGLSKPVSSTKNKRIDALVDSGMSNDPDLSVLKPRQDGNKNDAVSSKPATYVSGNIEDSEVHANGECAGSKLPHPPTVPNNAEENRSAFYWLLDIRRWYAKSDKENNDAESAANLKRERELKRLQSSVNYDGRKEKGRKNGSV